MQVVFTYNKFFNRYSDSLVSGSQSYYNFFWTGWADKFSYQANYSYQEVENNILSTLESGINYSSDKFKIGGSGKWNFLQNNIRMGYTASLGLLIKKLGTINLIYDRSFLPERTGMFFPVETGQVQIIKPLKFKVWQNN